MSQPAPAPLKQVKKPPRRRRDLMAGKEKQILACCFVTLSVAYIVFLVTLPRTDDIANAATAGSLQILDRDNKLVVTIDGDEEREYIPLTKIAKSVQHAVIAAEDHHFYDHEGISLRGIMRAFLSNAEAGRVVEGGSTITQQLAKNLFFESGERSLARKIREAAVATEIEAKYSKAQIMELYLNQVYFGRGAYGIERASGHYFGKSAAALTIPEAAYLAAILQAPSSLGRADNLAAATARQHKILDEMNELGYISAEQAEEAKKAKLVFNRSDSKLTKYPYYTNAVQQELKRKLPADLVDGGLRVYTNLDQQAQRAAERAVAQRVRSASSGMNQAALVSVLVDDGSVVALVGGSGDYWRHQWNSATGPHTMGSSFKPFVYLAAFISGKLSPDSTVDDAPLLVRQAGAPDWEPQNFDGEFYGPLSVRDALAFSRNTCAVRAGMAAGLDKVVWVAKEAGISGDLKATPAMTLGAAAVSPIEMAGAYATIARGGVYIEPRLVRRVEGRDGYNRDFGGERRRVFPESAVKQLISCLESAVAYGTGTAARLGDRPVAGKTGTSDEARDLWFVGFTPHMVTAIWGGNDKHRSLGGLTGGAALTGIWKNYNRRYYRDHKVAAGSFNTPSYKRRAEPVVPEPGVGSGEDRSADADPDADTGADADAQNNTGTHDMPASPLDEIWPQQLFPRQAPDREPESRSDTGSDTRSEFDRRQGSGRRSERVPERVPERGADSLSVPERETPFESMPTPAPAPVPAPSAVPERVPSRQQLQPAPYERGAPWQQAPTNPLPNQYQYRYRYPQRMRQPQEILPPDQYWPISPETGQVAPSH